MANPLGTVKTLLDDNWNSANTDSIKPTIDFSFHHKHLNLADNDYVLLFELDETTLPFGMGGTNFHETPNVRIDMKTTFKKAAITDVRAHMIKIQNEVKRIIKEKIIAPGGGYNLIQLTFRRDLSNKHTGIGRMIQDVRLDDYTC